MEGHMRMRLRAVKASSLSSPHLGDLDPLPLSGWTGMGKGARSEADTGNAPPRFFLGASC